MNLPWRKLTWARHRRRGDGHMRVGIVALQHETNTFIEAPTGIGAFRGSLLAAGDSLRDAVAGSQHELGGFFAGLEEAGAEAIPLFGARAMPYGLVSRRSLCGAEAPPAGGDQVSSAAGRASGRPARSRRQ